MSDDNEYSEHYESQPPGMSTGAKVLLISLSVLGVLTVFCCGGAIWFVKSNFDVQMTDDPVAIREAQKKIIELAIPARFEPKHSARVKMIVADMEVIEFNAKGEELSQFLLMKMTSPMGEMNEEQAQAQFNQQQTNQTQLNETNSETRKYTIGGKEISVKFAHGTLRRTDNTPDDQVGEEWFSVSSIMTVPGGMIMFNVTGPEDEYDEQEIENMIKSMRFPNAE